MPVMSVVTTESSQVVNTFALQLPLPRNVAINGNRWDSGAYFQLSTGERGGGGAVENEHAVGGSEGIFPHKIC